MFLTSQRVGYGTNGQWNPWYPPDMPEAGSSPQAIDMRPTLETGVPSGAEEQPEPQVTPVSTCGTFLAVSFTAIDTVAVEELVATMA